MTPFGTLETFLSQAAQRWPDRPALLEGATALTWSALNDTAARVAAALARRGVAPGSRVGLCGPKSARIVASIHGVLKAGCVCVPVDPASPAARMRAVLDDCTPAAVIGTAEMLLQVGLAAAPVRISLDRPVEGALFWDDVMAADRAAEIVPQAAPPAAGDLAYLLYTSGSTGQPKGVMLSHQNVGAFAVWAAEEFRLAPDDRVASLAPLHFDLSTFDLYSTAWTGAALHIPPALYLSFPVKLTGWLDTQAITAMYTVPSLLAMIAERGDVKTRHLDSLRLLLFAGEVCPPRLLATLLDLFPGVEFANLYGPTETNVCTFERIDRAWWDRLSPISIGVPCQGTTILLVGDDGVPVAGIGLSGEVQVSGPTVALGYWRDQEKTAARFTQRDGARWCRTGDYAELDPTGRLVFHGRRDHMVKIRGYRVELGEIESALLSHPAIAEAAVVAVDEVLVAFARPSGPAPSGDEIREHCVARLTRHMVPAEVRILDSLPHGSTGKIDRLALQRMVQHG